MSAILIINTLLYIAYAVIASLRKHYCLMFVVTIWAVSSLCGTIYCYLMSVYLGTTFDINVIPVAYIALGFLITTIPLFKLQSKEELLYDNDFILKVLSVFIIALAILPFFANVAYAATHLNAEAAESFADNYYDETYEVLPPLYSKLNAYTALFRTIAPVLFFYFLQKKGNLWLLIGLGMAVVEPSLNNLNNGSRFVIMVDALYLLALYIILRKTMSPQTTKIVKGAGLIVGVFAGILFTFITFFRFSDSDDDNVDAPVAFMLCRYAGEGIPDFSDEMWESCQHTNGLHAFALAKYMMGDSSSEFRDPMLITGRSGIRGYIFYTFIGDYYLDYGIVGGMLIAIVQGLLLWLFIINYNRNPTVYNLIWISMILKILISGFTYFPYMNNSYELVITPLVNIMLILFNNQGQIALKR